MSATQSFRMALVAAVVLLLAGLMAPTWLQFLVTMSAANGLAVLGIVVLMRGGKFTIPAFR